MQALLRVQDFCSAGAQIIRFTKDEHGVDLARYFNFQFFRSVRVARTLPSYERKTMQSTEDAHLHIFVCSVIRLQRRACTVVPSVTS